MNIPVRILAVLLAATVSTVDAKSWVFIVAGAEGYNNYWSQSSACHAYHTVLNKGVLAKNIIQISYDDVAHSPENPIKGNLVTKPNGKNWYPGCKIDYREKEATWQVFLKALSGDKAGVRKLIGRDGPVIESGPNDNIFLYMVDHGEPGVFYFPGSVPLHAEDLMSTLKQMHEDRKYRQMMIYMDSCESGSMFKGLLPNDINIYTVSCGDYNESCYIAGYDEFRDAYVVTQFALAWEYNTDAVDVSKVTLEEQFHIVKKSLNSTSTPSTAHQYGDLTINKEYLGQFQGDMTEVQTCDNSGPFVSKDFKMQFEGMDLSNPPLDMLTTATLARRLVEPEHLSVAETQYGDATISKEFLGQFTRNMTEEQKCYNTGPLVSKDLKMQFEGMDLNNPPLDMVTIATLARRLVASKRQSAAEKGKIQAQLKHALKIKAQAEEVMKDVVRAMIVDSSDDVVNKIMTSRQPVLNTSCYKSSLDLLVALCPGFNLGRYEFTRRNLWALINLCNVFPVSQIEAGITKVAETHSLCWSQ